jgi:SulP family sulfate permease
MTHSATLLRQVAALWRNLFKNRLPAVDVTAGGVLRGLARSLKARDIAIVLAGLRDDVRENLTAVGAEQDLGLIPAHRTIGNCLRHVAASSPMKIPG